MSILEHPQALEKLRWYKVHDTNYDRWLTFYFLCDGEQLVQDFGYSHAGELPCDTNSYEYMFYYSMGISYSVQQALPGAIWQTKCRGST